MNINWFSLNNLKLAWQRIVTGQNYLYKKYFRNLYNSYELGIDLNLKVLHDKLASDIYEPKSPVRIFIPKQSGLQRPITLLYLEDQIVLQAIANIFENKIRKRRQKLEKKNIFSNLLNDKKNIFFLKDWRLCYTAFENEIQRLFNDNFRWVAYFDLAEFYETISHDLLFKAIFPRTNFRESNNRIQEYLGKWSSPYPTSKHTHGIPQGPIASDFLAECFFLPIDEKLSKKSNFIRYCDDIKIFGKSEYEVQKAAITLEIQCRNRGLIPQAKKFRIEKLDKLDEPLKLLPSIPPIEDFNDETDYLLQNDEAEKLFNEAIDEKESTIKDKSKIRYVLFRAEPNNEILQKSIALIPKHIEQIDSFFHYFEKYQNNSVLLSLAMNLLDKSPYDYVKGESWHYLAKRIQFINVDKLDSLKDTAISTSRNYQTSFSEKWGACHFLCKYEKISGNRLSRFAKYHKDALLQSFLVPIIPIERFEEQDELIQKIFNRSSFEPGLMLANIFIENQFDPKSFGINIKKHPQVQHSFIALGMISSKKTISDLIGNILADRFNIKLWRKWPKLLGNEYGHCLRILKIGNTSYNSDRNSWLSHQNSFNHALFLKILARIKTLKLSGYINPINKKGRLINFGALIDVNSSFSKTYPKIADAFRNTNSRRNRIPASHPYELNKQKRRTTFLKKSEQKKISNLLKNAFDEVIHIFDSHF